MVCVIGSAANGGDPVVAKLEWKHASGAGPGSRPRVKPRSPVRHRLLYPLSDQSVRTYVAE